MEDGKERVAVGVVGGWREVGGGDVAGAAVDDEAWFVGAGFGVRGHLRIHDGIQVVYELAKKDEDDEICRGKGCYDRVRYVRSTRYEEAKTWYEYGMIAGLCSFWSILTGQLVI